MRILVAHSQYRWPGGEETTIRNQKQALEERGHEVVLHVVENPTTKIASLGALAVAPFNPLEYRSAIKAIRETEPDVVHVHNTWFQLSPAIFRAAEHEGVPTVATIQNYRLACPQGQFFRDGGPCTDCLGRFPWPGVRHACYRESKLLSLCNGLTTSVAKRSGLLDSVSAFVVPSAFARDLLIGAGLPGERTEVIYNAVPDPGARKTSPSSSNRLVFVGRLSPEKGAEPLIAAFRDSDKDLSLFVIGDGPIRTRLAREPADRITFTGMMKQSEISRILLTARALIFPSLWFEVCPLVILEALAAGLPVIASSVGAIPELLPGTHSDRLVQPERWDNAVDQLSDDKGLDELGLAGRALYESRYSLQRHASRVERLYERIALQKHG